MSILVENAAQAAAWCDTPVGLFIDVNTGMDRTGIPQDHIAGIVDLARAIGGQFRGIHYYDGHILDADRAQRERTAHRGYDHLMRIVGTLETAGVPERVPALSMLSQAGPLTLANRTVFPGGVMALVLSEPA